jgi:hypothetical protein
VVIEVADVTTEWEDPSDHRLDEERRREQCEDEPSSLVWLGLGLSLVGTASSDPNPNAACEGWGSVIAQAGQRGDTAQFIVALAAELGIAPGEIHTFFAGEHAQTFEACFGFPPPTG